MTAILEVNNLKKYFSVSSSFLRRSESFVKAVDGVNLSLDEGKILGIVGESGCGKTTLVNTILNLEEATAGEVYFEGSNLFELREKEMKQMRKKIQIVFQDPFWSLNPRMLVKEIIAEPLKVHMKLSSIELINETKRLMKKVGLQEEGIYKYPHEFSGGQRQRIAIARALAIEPRLLILDEPTSSIDVLSQALILEMLKDLKEELNLTYIIISHDLSVVSYMADEIAVMYLGKVVEYGNAKKIFNNPTHPYTKALLESIPEMDENSVNDLGGISGNVPSAINPPSGCSFHTRCHEVVPECKKWEPELIRVSDDQMGACLLLK